MSGADHDGVAPAPGPAPAAVGWLDRIERLGNALPDPATLFLIGALLVMVLSEAAVRFDWQVERQVMATATEPVLGRDGRAVIDPANNEPVEIARLDPTTGRVALEARTQVLRATSLLRSDGVFWALDNMVSSFVNFAPLGVVLVGMLGIGVAERSGLIGTALRSVMVAVPPALLTPTMVFVGVLSSLGLDAGYVVLPPVAAALYHAVGRSPLAGLAAVFAGVSAGFSANLVVTSLDPMLAEFTNEGAHLLDPTYQVGARANLYFIRASTLLLTGVGWATTAWWVEPRLTRKPVDEGGPDPEAEALTSDTQLSELERRGLLTAALALAIGAVVAFAAVWLPGAPLHGSAGRFPRWVEVIVPLLFLGFLFPGLAYGWVTGRFTSDRDVAATMGETMAGMGGYIVLAFFAAQFIAYFKYSGLGVMLAISGGQVLAEAGLGPVALMGGFVLLTMGANLVIGSMSAKYAFFAPVFVPMFMQVGISPELTQVAYRVGDSVTNIITPLNPYMVIVLVFVQRYVARSGLGTIVALMLPYSLAFAVTWISMLLAWIALGIPLGPEGPLSIPIPGALPN